MLAMVTALVFAAAVGCWIWSFLDVAARSHEDLPNKARWILFTTAGGPFGALLWTRRRRALGPLPPLHAGQATPSHVRLLEPVAGDPGADAAYAEAAAPLMAPGEI